MLAGNHLLASLQQHLPTGRLCRLVGICLLFLAAGTAQTPEPKLRVSGNPLRELLAKPIGPPVPDGGVVEVHSDGRPLAGVDVFVVDRADLAPHKRELDTWQATPRDALDRAEQLAIWFGMRTQTGADGVTRVARRDDVQVFARAGNKLAQRRVRDWDGSPIRLDLVAHCEVGIQVVDTKGKPVRDIPIEFGTLRSDEQFLADSTSMLMPRRSDSEGRVHMRLGTKWPANDRGSPAVRARIRGNRQVTAELRRAADGNAAAVRLTVPLTGGVRVLLYDQAERPIAQAENIRLEIVRDDPYGFYLSDFEIDLNAAAKPTLIDGKTFPHVELGLRVRAIVRVRGVAGELSVEADGPKLPGELVVVPVRMQAADPIVRCQILDLAGAPAQRAALWLVHPAPAEDGKPEVRAVRCDEHGVLQFTVSREWLGKSPDRRVQLVRRTMKARRAEYLGACEIQLPADATGKLDLGERRLVEEPVVLRGKVVDSKGQPVPEVALRADTTRARDADDYSDHRLEHRAVSADDGSFELRELGADPSQTLAVKLGKGRWQMPDRAQWSIGTLDAVIKVCGPASLTLRLPGVPEGLTLDLRLRKHDTDFDGPKTRLRADAEGRFVWRDLPVGTYSLCLGDGYGGEPFAAGLVLEPDTECRDPRLDATAWRERLVLCELAITKPNGEPLRDNVRFEISAGDSRLFTHIDPRRDKWHLLTKGATVTIRNEGWRSVTLPASEKLAVTLQPRPELLLELPAKLRLPDDVAIVVTSADGEPVIKRWTADQPMLLRPDGDGELQCSLRVDLPNDLPARYRHFDGGAATIWTGTVHMPKDQPHYKFVLPIDTQVIADADAAIAAAKEQAEERKRGK